MLCLCLLLLLLLPCCCCCCCAAVVAVCVSSCCVCCFCTQANLRTVCPRAATSISRALGWDIRANAETAATTSRKHDISYAHISWQLHGNPTGLVLVGVCRHAVVRRSVLHDNYLPLTLQLLTEHRRSERATARDPAQIRSDPPKTLREQTCVLVYTSTS